MAESTQFRHARAVQQRFFLENVGDAISEIEDAVESIWKPVATDVTDAAEVIADLFGTVEGGIEAAIGVIRDEIDDIHSAARAEFEAFVGCIDAISKGDFDSLKAQIAELATIPAELLQQKALAALATLKKIVEAIANGIWWLLRMIAEQVVDDAIGLCNTMTKIPAMQAEGVNDIIAGIRASKPEQVMAGFAKLIGSPAFISFAYALDKSEFASLTMSVDSSAAAGVGVGNAQGVAIDIKAVMHLIENKGNLLTFNGTALSFFTVNGFTLFDAGVGNDLCIGLDRSTPDEIGGSGIDIGVELKLEVGGSAAVGFEAELTFPPEFASLTVGCGAGAKLAANLGYSITSLLDTDVFTFGEGEPDDDGAEARAARLGKTARRLVALKQPKLGNPKVEWLLLDRSSLPADVSKSLDTIAGTQEAGGSIRTRAIAGGYARTWNKLDPATVRAANDLQIRQSQWDGPFPTGAAARKFETDEAKIKDAVNKWKTAGPTKYWSQFTWDEVGPNERRLFQTLGWSSELFDELHRNNGVFNGFSLNKFPLCYYKSWTDLTEVEQIAAAQLGYWKSVWPEYQPSREAQTVNSVTAIRAPADIVAGSNQQGPTYKASENMRTIRTGFGIYGMDTEHPEHLYRLIDGEPMPGSKARTRWQSAKGEFREGGNRGGHTTLPFRFPRRIETLVIRHGAIVDGLTINGDGDKIVGGGNGGTDGNCRLSLRAGEVITKCTIRSGTDRWVNSISYIKFETNMGAYAEGGDGEGEDKVLVDGQGIAAIGGWGDDYLHGICLIVPGLRDRFPKRALLQPRQVVAAPVRDAAATYAAGPS